MRGALALVVLVGCGFSVSGSAGDGGPSGDDGGGSSVDARADWWDAHWSERSEISVATNKLGGSVTDFPVLVRLTNVRDAGHDLRFVSHDNTTVYPFELDSIDSVGTATAWVKLTLTPTTPMKLWVYTGNAVATDVSDGASVFGAYESASHLGTLTDSTGHGHTASADPMTTPMVATGIVGDARDFDGADDFLELANSTALNFTNAMTLSVWVEVDAFDKTYQCAICKGNGAWRLSRANIDNGMAFDTTSSSGAENLHGAVVIDDQKFHLVTALMTATAKVLYIDGVSDGAMTYTAPLSTTTAPVRIGMNTEATVGPPGRWWNGRIDEVRLRATAVDAAWVAAEYRTVTDPTFVTVGAVETY